MVMPIKRRTYNTRLIRRGHAYYVQEVADRFVIHKNAVRNWVKQGLKTIDGNRPMMIHGSDLADFLDNRQRSRKRACMPDEFFCCKCRMPRRAWERLVDLTQLKKERWLVKAICCVCSANMRRIFPARNMPELHRLFIIQTVNEEHIKESFNPLVMRDFNQGE
jgi:hypothetical protein